jgi:hypothetical protein
MDARISLDGAVDIHTHCGPSVFERRVDGYECALEAADAGMDGVVLKEHHLPTVHGVPHIERRLAAEGVDVEVVGSAVLNYCNGGFNPFLVQTAIDNGAGVIWGPTIDARHHAEQTGSLGAFLGAEAGREYEDVSGLSALEDGELTADVRRCLDKVVENDVLFCLGHLSFEETLAIADYLADSGHERFVVDHPTYDVTDLDVDQQRALVDRGAVLNFPFLALSEDHGWATGEELYESIRAVGVEHCVLSSDVGQTNSPTSAEALGMLGEALLAEGLTADEFRELVVTRPKRLLGMA